MAANVYTTLARGNFELFHSAMIAWLMDPKAPHGRGSDFLAELLRIHSSRVAQSIPSPSPSYEVLTEHTQGRLRFDILVRPINDHDPAKAIVFENKVKAFGAQLQVNAYAGAGYRVLPLVLIPELLDRSLRGPDVLTYADVLAALGALQLAEATNHHHWLVGQYRDYIGTLVGTYDRLRAYGEGTLKWTDLRSFIQASRSGWRHRQNDTRTHTQFYCLAFSEYLSAHRPDLVFGTADYAAAEASGVATRWIVEKNMQGPPFMEALLHGVADSTASYQLKPQLLSQLGGHGVCIAPRLELRVDVNDLVQQSSEQANAGLLMLGSWNDSLKKFLKSTAPYSATLKRKGSRHFHAEPVGWQDLPFGLLADKLHHSMRLIGDFH